MDEIKVVATKGLSRGERVAVPHSEVGEASSQPTLVTGGGALDEAWRQGQLVQGID